MSTSVLTTLTEVKSLLQITSTSQDTLITSLIPITLEDINRITDNYFLQSTRVVYTNQIFSSVTIMNTTATTSAPGTTSYSYRLCLETSGNTYLMFNENFQAGDTLYVNGSKFNDGYFTAASVGSTDITLNEAVTSEPSTSGKFLAVYRVDFPRDLPMQAAQMIDFTINKDYGSLQSESLGDYSYNSGSLGKNQYSENILAALNKYKYLKVY